MRALRKISVVGLGKLGLPLAALLADRGFTVVGIERRASVRRALARGRALFFEPGLETLLGRVRGRLTATDDPAAVAETDATLLLVATPSRRDGSFSLRDLLTALRDIGPALRAKRGYHLVCVCSTVNPGDIEHILVPALERAAGRAVGRDLGICYNPEFLALGHMLRGFSRPDFVLIGEGDARAGRLLAGLHRRLAGTAPIVRTSLLNAEIGKLAVNAFLGLKVSFVNMLADLCHRLPGARVDDVTRVLGHDPRIGRRFLRGGLAFGGPCLPRDQRSLARLARRVRGATALPLATLAVNRHTDRTVLEALCREVPRGGTIAVLGLAFKPGTCVVAESPGLALARALARRGRRVRAYDPRAGREAARVLPASVEICASASAALRGARAIAVTTPWPEFRRLNARALKRAAPAPLVFDAWRILDPATLGSARYCAWGVGA